MARTSYAEAQIPTAVEDIPYPSHRKVAGMLQHAAELFVGEVLGAGGVGGSLLGVPFEPGIIDVYEATGPTMVRRLPGAAGAIYINLITGAVIATTITVTQAVDGTWTVALPTALAPDGDTATVVCTGVKNVGGSL